MKIDFTKKELEYLKVDVSLGYEVDLNFKTDKQIAREQKLWYGIQKKIDKAYWESK